MHQLLALNDYAVFFPFNTGLQNDLFKVSRIVLLSQSDYQRMDGKQKGKTKAKPKSKSKSQTQAKMKRKKNDYLDTSPQCNWRTLDCCRPGRTCRHWRAQGYHKSGFGAVGSPDRNLTTWTTGPMTHPLQHSHKPRPSMPVIGVVLSHSLPLSLFNSFPAEILFKLLGQFRSKNTLEDMLS